MSLTRTGSIRKDASKSTADGEWEMRDGKWYRKDYYAVEADETCKQCPIHLQRIQVLIRERDELQRLLQERDRLIAELRARLEKWEIESKNWILERQRLEARIRELEEWLRSREGWINPALIKEKEMLILQLEERIRFLLSEKESLLNKLARLAVMIEDFERQWAVCKSRGFLCNCKAQPAPVPQVIQAPPCAPSPPPPPGPSVVSGERMWYNVDTPQIATMFHSSGAYLGGEILVDSLKAPISSVTNSTIVPGTVAPVATCLYPGAASTTTTTVTQTQATTTAAPAVGGYQIGTGYDWRTPQTTAVVHPGLATVTGMNNDAVAATMAKVDAILASATVLPTF